MRRNRVRLAVAALWLLLGMDAPAREEPAEAEGSVILHNLSAPGSFAVENRGSDITLARPVIVQREQAGRWTDETTDLALLESCGQAGGACLTLPAGAKLNPLPWNGLVCASQCAQGCRANIYLGPGRFRFVLSSCDGRRQFHGPPFDLPPYDPKKR